VTSSSSSLELTRRVVEALNKGDLIEFCSYFSPDVTVSFMRSGRRIVGRAGVREWLDEATAKIGALSNDVLGVHGDETTVTLEVRAHGVPKVDLPGAAAGTQWEKFEAYIYEFEGGLISLVRCY
jgi:ketosteroid isomerase-like protein